MMDLFSNPVFNLFFILSIGFAVSKFKIGGIPIGIIGVLFFSLFMGHFGFTLPEDFQMLGLIVFMYAVGIQTGPGFFKVFDRQGRPYLILTIGLVLMATLTAGIITVFFDVEKDLMLGIFTGSMVMTPALPVAVDAVGNSLPLVGYSIGYPFALIATCLCAKFFPKIFRKTISEAEAQVKSQIKKESPEILSKTFEVQNREILGKNLIELRFREITKGNISKVKQGDDIFTPDPNTILNSGDRIKVIGDEAVFARVKILIGPEVSESLASSKEYQSQLVLVTSSKVINKTLQQLNLSGVYNALVTQINRGGISLSAHPNSKLQMGDRVMISANKDDMKNVMYLLGNNNRKLSDIDFLSVGTGIILGMGLGKLNIPFTSSVSFSFGITAGVLIVALLLGRIGKIGPIIWSMSVAGSKILEQWGLLLFLVSVGTKVGGEISQVFHNYSFEYFMYGAAITLIPLFTTGFIAVRFFKMHALEMLGVTTIGSSAMSIANAHSDTEVPKKIYASVHPVTLVLFILVIQIISRLI